MPGPWSRATILRPRRPLLSMAQRTISPRCAWTTMLRATSEMAVAISVCSVLPNPLAAASSRPFWRATTMSVSHSTGTRTSSGMVAAPLAPCAQELEAFLQIQRGGHALEREAELHHGKCHLGLDPHHHRLGAAQPGGVGDAEQRAGGERVEHVERGDVDDHAVGAQPPDPVCQLVAQREEVVIGQPR